MASLARFKVGTVYYWPISAALALGRRHKVPFLLMTISRGKPPPKMLQELHEARDLNDSTIPREAADENLQSPGAYVHLSPGELSYSLSSLAKSDQPKRVI